MAATTILASSVPPAAFSVTWRGCTREAALSAAVVGQIIGITAWLVLTFTISQNPKS